MKRRFLAKALSFFGIQAILFGSIVAFYIANKDQSNQNYFAATIDKHELLNSQPGPRMIFVGGSNVAFGIDSEYIAQQLNFNPVNMGLHAGLGLEFMLKEVEASLKPGDLVIVSLEYEHFVDLQPHLPERLFSTLDSRPANLQFVPYYYAPELSDSFLNYIGSMLRMTKKIAAGQVESEPVYRRGGFDSYGDVISHFNADGRNLSNDTAVIDATPQSIQDALQVLNNFNEIAESRGARVVYSYTPFLERLFEQNANNIQLIEQTMNDRSEFMIIDSPEDLALPDHYFFDSAYHLNQKGVRFRATHIANSLKAMLEHEDLQGKR